MNKWEWAGLILGSLILIFGFIFDYSQYMLSHFDLIQILNMKNPEVMQFAFSYIPRHFPWGIFILGESIIIIAIGLFWKRLLGGP